VHGIAIVLSVKILGYVGDITRFPTADHFASHTGTSRGGLGVAARRGGAG
jgi:hypothetical protein